MSDTAESRTAESRTAESHNTVSHTTEPHSAQKALQTLRDPATIRSRAQYLLARARAGDSSHFVVNEVALSKCVEFVLQTTQKNYPDFQVPFHSRWRHFEAGGVDRAAPLVQRIEREYGTLAGIEKARVGIELAVISVLLDAGAGMQWKYLEKSTQTEYRRSEGLAVASFDLFANGFFAQDGRSLRADSARLKLFSAADLAQGFQVDSANPLIGVESRASLIQKLGELYPDRLGTLADELRSLSQTNANNDAIRTIEAKVILNKVLEVFSAIWPVRLTLGGYSLGDVWRHSAIEAHDATAGLMPFHKLSQWLAYSLMEPLQWAGITTINLDAMTGLPEYRNGGLLLDMKVLQPRELATALEKKWSVGDEFIVEWRALTVAILDEIAALIRTELKLSAEQFPLVKMLQGGSWAAGRLTAQGLRADGGPPLLIESDGTVF
jgi:hypothetical protein